MSEKYKFRSTRKSCSQKSEANHQKPISKSQKRAEIIQSEDEDQIMKKEVKQFRDEIRSEESMEVLEGN